MMKKNGIALITAVLLMTLLAITAFSLSAFVIERLRFTSARENEINAYYMAQAGVHYGIYKYRKDDAPSSGTYNLYADRKFDWSTTIVGSNLTIMSTGYCPKAGSNQIQKRLTAVYNTSTKKITSIGYQ